MRTLVRLSAALLAGWLAAPSARAMEVSKDVQLRQAMDKLWEDHVTWTRTFIISALANLPDKQATLDRLLQNQVDIGNAIKPYYGDDAGNKLTALLHDHIVQAGDVVTAAAANDKAKLEEANKVWRANADQIATFLSAANPHWAVADMKAMMNKHLDLTTEEAVARIKQDWKADVAAYDKVHNEILQMSEMLSTGIIQQFPDKFGGRRSASAH